MSDSDAWYRQSGLKAVGVAPVLRPLVCSLLCSLLFLGMQVVVPDAHAALALSNDQTDATSPDGAPLSAETQRLFQAVRAGDLAAVQQAVIDGADVLARNDDGTNAADLAESLNHFTITHFLRTYQAIEGYEAAPTTVVETEEPGPIPPPDTVEPSTEALSGTSISGRDVVPAGEVMETAPIPSTATPQTAFISEFLDEETEAEPETGMQGTSGAPDDEPDGGDYFSRLSLLNPTHEPLQAETVAPTGQVIEGDDDLQNLTSIGATLSSEVDAVAVEEPDNTSSSSNDEPSVVMMSFSPLPPLRKPEEDAIGETSIFASVDRGEEMDVPMLAEVPMPEFPQPDTPPGTQEEMADGGFFSQMRKIDESSSGAASAQSDSAPNSPDLARNTEMIPQFEQIRAAVIEKLRRESNERSKLLADVRGENQKLLEAEDMAREHLSGSMNVQTELRAKQRTIMTGSAFPPGYVPPPDGGTSGIRFLQRLGLYGDDESIRTVEAESPYGSVDGGLPTGSSSYGSSGMTEAGENLLLPALSPTKLAKKTMSFVDSGYSAPPAGQTIDTAEDNAAAALGQIARLFQSSDIGYPDQAAGLPAPGALPPASSQIASKYDTVGGITMPQSSSLPPSNAPLSASDLATPPPMASGAISGDRVNTPPDTQVPEIPVGQDALAQLGDPLQPAAPQLVPGWDVTATDNQGNVVPPLPSVAASTSENTGGLTTQLSQMFDPVDTADVTAGKRATGSAGFTSAATATRLPAEEITGSWDVVSVQAAPTAARTLLGGAVVPQTSATVSGSGFLSMGQSVALGKAPPIGADPVARKKACIDKRRGAILFCIEHIDWPVELQSTMQVDTVMYQGLNAIVRYDNGVATRFHALFPSESFNTVVSYYMQRLGNPTNVWRRTISPLAAPDRENPTVSWQALNPHTQVTSTLEIRQFDDTRGGFPDEKRGAVTLYSAHSGPIFPQVSAFELMRLHPGS